MSFVDPHSPQQPATEVSVDFGGMDSDQTEQIADALRRSSLFPLSASDVAGGVSGGAAPGDIKMSGVDLSTGWLICDGTLVSRTTYAVLFAAVGVKFGIGDGTTTFAVPDMRSLVPIGAGPLGIVGATGGEAAHTLSTTEMPSHAHGGATSSGTASISDPSHTHGIPVGGPGIGSVSAIGTARSGTVYGDLASTGITDLGHTHSIPSDGSGGSHNNLQPYVAVNFFIKT